MSETHGGSYKGYWAAWFFLLVLTVLMVFMHNKTLILAGIGVKSTVILLWFMHLKYEKKGLTLSVILITAAMLAVLYVLVVGDIHPNA